MDPKSCSVSIARTLHSSWKELASAFLFLEATWSYANCQQESGGTQSPVAHDKRFLLLDA